MLIPLRRKQSATRLTSKEALVALYASWARTKDKTAVTVEVLTGLFYHRYKQRFRLMPASSASEDIENLSAFLSQHTIEPPTAVNILNAWFDLDQFEGFRTSTLLNHRVVEGFRLLERGSTYQRRASGEQSEFRNTTMQATVYV